MDLLTQHFGNIVDIGFTARMEEELDLVEEGKMNWKEVIRDFYDPFNADLEKAQDLIEKVEIKDEDAGKECPQCGKPLLIKHGRFGKFIACSGFPDCRYTESINEEAGVNCPICSGPVLALKSKKGRRYYGCKNYPECNFRSWNKPTGEKCPICGDAMVEKYNKQGSQAVCQNPECKHRSESREHVVAH